MTTFPKSPFDKDFDQLGFSRPVEDAPLSQDHTTTIFQVGNRVINTRGEKGTVVGGRELSDWNVTPVVYDGDDITTIWYTSTENLTLLPEGY